MKKTILILLLISTKIFPQETNEYWYNEVYEIIQNNFNVPIISEYKYMLNDNYRGFGYKINPFTGEIRYSTFGIICCQNNDKVFSMTNGIVKDIGFDSEGQFVIIEYDDFEIEYKLVESIDINIGSIVEKGQLIGRIHSPYYSFGPALFVRIKYKNIYLDPNILLIHMFL
jgi:murein DD-endopeptidase MepM/ murein hydrolase activator NlpD